MVNDRGATEPLVLPAAMALAATSILVAWVGQFAILHERARTAADFAALAALDSGRGCQAAAEAATRNHASLTQCVSDGGSARVSVVIPSNASAWLRRAGIPEEFTASARAAA